MLTLFYLPELPDGEEVLLSGDNARHAISSLRAEVGEEFRLSDGKGSYLDFQVVQINKKDLIGKVINRGKDSPRAQKISLIQALPKNSRLKEAIELLTESGVDEIIPWQAARSIGKFAPGWQDKWLEQIKEAGAQSRRHTLPLLGEEFKEGYEKLLGAGDLLLVFHESAPLKFSQWVNGSAAAQLAEAENIYALVGPEGGLTEDEIAKAANAGATVLTLGDEVYRSAHVGVAIVSILNFILGRY